jgi:hypothetical protein
MTSATATRTEQQPALARMVGHAETDLGHLYRLNDAQMVAVLADGVVCTCPTARRGAPTCRHRELVAQLRPWFERARSA